MIRVFAAFVFGLAFATSTLLSTARTFACTAYITGNHLGADGPIYSDTPYFVRERIPVELDAYASTGDAQFDKNVRFEWKPTAIVKDDPAHHGRAFFHPGYIQGIYAVQVIAHYQPQMGPEQTCNATATMNVQPDYTQFVEGFGGSGSGARLVDEFTQATVPFYLTLRDESESGSRLDRETRFGVKLLDPRIYAGIGARSYTDAFGNRTSGWGYGAERLPDADRAWSAGWQFWYYPNLVPSQHDGAYHMVSYGLSIAHLLPGDRYLAELGFHADSASASGALRGFDRVIPFGGLALRL